MGKCMLNRKRQQCKRPQWPVCVWVCVSSSPSLPSLSFALCSSLFLAAARQIRYILLSLSFPFCVLFLKNRCLLLGCGVSKNLPLMVEFTNSGAFIAFARLLLPLLLSRFTCCQLICINYFLTSKHERGCGQRGGGGRWVAYIRCPCRENKKTVGQPAIRTGNDNDSWLTNNWTELWTPTTITTTTISVLAKWKQQLQLSNRYYIC